MINEFETTAKEELRLALQSWVTQAQANNKTILIQLRQSYIILENLFVSVNNKALVAKNKTRQDYIAEIEVLENIRTQLTTILNQILLSSATTPGDVGVGMYIKDEEGNVTRIFHKNEIEASVYAATNLPYPQQFNKILSVQGAAVLQACSEEIQKAKQDKATYDQINKWYGYLKQESPFNTLVFSQHSEILEVLMQLQKQGHNVQRLLTIPEFQRELIIMTKGNVAWYQGQDVYSRKYGINVSVKSIQINQERSVFSTSSIVSLKNTLQQLIDLLEAPSNNLEKAVNFFLGNEKYSFERLEQMAETIGMNLTEKCLKLN